MKQLVYVSFSSSGPDEDDLRSIQTSATRRNPKLGVTGVLLFGSGRFLQLLEGPTRSVDQLLARIEADPRHARLRVLFERPTERRVAQAWSMGVLNLDGLPDSAPCRPDLDQLTTACEHAAADDEAADAIRALVVAFESVVRGAAA